MRNSNILLFLVLLLLILSCFFRRVVHKVEGFFNWNTIDLIVPLSKPGAIHNVHIRYIGQYANTDPYINLLDLTMLDRNGNRIPYQNGQVYFEGGNWPGYPVNHLWDDNWNTMAHAQYSRSNLIINLNPPQEISQVHITTRYDCCWDRNANFRLVFYQNGQEIGSKHMFQHRDRSQTGVYTLVQPGGPGAQGAQGAKGDKGDKGDKGNTGDIGQKGLQGIQGAQGAQGLKGDTGATGAQGIQGPKGDFGVGPQGAQGLKGDTGPQGIQGVNGTRGEVGSIGIEGVAGANCNANASS